ncbi:hydrogenase expression/formation protein HypE [Helicobacter sp. 16-1353]|uniref:hydrogenase expression/formation protein HypE n=1 Tax=Helicobacter sp. 16-1353 TaxID=2004996 RepID=UPI000DCEF524|nr:hydrogenase expression/formation protein HypE [Helicobacter sp. 16-1353]RAX54887.1 hydrogenase expression/formation protein HypE [Helicobacter sp. 16-1353]
MDRILLSCGNGGRENANLINNVFMKYFKDFAKYAFEDAGFFAGFSNKLSNDFAISTDSYTITPIFFPGGDIGKLSICGSCNDVAVSGAKPMYLTISFIIEEGFLVQDLEKIAKSMSEEMHKNNLTLLSADTKVVPKGSVEGVFINSTIIGKVEYKGLSAKNLKEDDVIILNAPIGSHGACIYCLRNNISLENNLQSDCASLWEMIEVLLKNNIEIHAIRDATRGGIAALLNEWANSSKKDIYINQNDILILDEVRGICEILGIEPYSLANEGVCAFALPESKANKALEILHNTNLGKDSRIIGRVCKNDLGNKVILQNTWGTKRYLEYPEGEILPRIC